MLLWYSHVLCISVLTFSYIGTPGPSEDGTGRRGRSIKDRVTFVSGNPMVDVTHGILHLYKEKYDQQFFCVYLRTHLLYCIHGLSYSNLKMMTCILMKEILMSKFCTLESKEAIFTLQYEDKLGGDWITIRNVVHVGCSYLYDNSWPSPIHSPMLLWDTAYENHQRSYTQPVHGAHQVPNTGED